MSFVQYLAGTLGLIAGTGLAGYVAVCLRAHLLPGWTGPVGWAATLVLATLVVILVTLLPGTFGLLSGWLVLLLLALSAAIFWRWGDRVPTVRGSAPLVHVPASTLLNWTGFAIAAAAFGAFSIGMRMKFGTGMTGFDSTWYHGPFAAGIAQTGDTFSLHYLAPQFLSWFYPQNSELFHALGMVAYGNDLASPLINAGWFGACLLAAWCVGRPYGGAPISLAGVAIVLASTAMADQAGEARNDIVGIFFLLAAVAIAVNAWAGRDGKGLGSDQNDGLGMGGMSAGELAVAGLAVGLAAGTKLNFLLPAAVLVVGLALIAPRGARWRAFAIVGLGALAGGGYWYLRNLVQAGNPLPWVDSLGPISLPAPEQALGGREAHSVLGYLTDGTVWSDWFLPGLHAGLWFLWPLLAAAALAGLVLCVSQAAAPRSRGSFRTQEAKKEPRDEGGDSRGSFRPSEFRKEPRDGEGGSRDLVLALAGLVGLATALAWLVAPTSASGPEGMPRGFESGLRYLAPALVLGLVLLPAAPRLRDHVANIGARLSLFAQRANKERSAGRDGRAWVVMMGLVALVVAVVLGYPVQRHYLEGRYADPSFTTPGLNAAFAWASGVSDSRIATTSTRQYPLFGTDLSNRVAFVGAERPHGGFETIKTCPAYREFLNAGDFDYVVASKDREEPGKPPYPPQAKWTESPSSQIVLKKPPTVVFKLNGPLDPSSC